MNNISLRKYLFVCAIGFGLGGLVWGWITYLDRDPIGYTSPFHYLSIPIMAVFGGLAVSILSRNWKTMVKSVVAGFLGQTIGYVALAFLINILTMAGVLILGFLPIPIEAAKRMNTNPIGIGAYWLIFLMVGGFVGLSYSLFLRKKNKWSIVWRSAVGMAVGSFFGPACGCFFGDIFQSLLIEYLLTFFFMTVPWGLALGYGLYGYGREKI